MASTWSSRVLSYDAATGNFNTALPFHVDEASTGVNGQGGAFSGNLDLTSTDVQALNPWAATIPGKTILVVELTPPNGQPQIFEAYDLTVRSRKITSKKIEVSGAPQLWNYFNQRAQITDYSAPPNSPLASPMTYWAQQPFDVTLIAAQVFADVQNFRLSQAAGALASTASILGGEIGLLINGLPPNALSPVVPAASWVAPTFPFSSVQYIGSMFQQLSGYGYGVGFDFDLIVNYSGKPGSQLQGTLKLWYPRSGRSAALSNLSIQAAGAREGDFSEDAGQQGTTIIETGIQGGIWIQDNVFPLEQGWPVRDKIVSHSGAIGPNLVGLLAATAASDSYLASFPPVAPVLTMPLEGLDPSVLSIQRGDDATLQLASCEIFPGGLTGEWRIVNISVKRPDSGDATVDLTLNTPPAATAVAPSIT